MLLEFALLKIPLGHHGRIVTKKLKVFSKMAKSFKFYFHFYLRRISSGNPVTCISDGTRHEKCYLFCDDAPGLLDGLDSRARGMLILLEARHLV